MPSNPPVACPVVIRASLGRIAASEPFRHAPRLTAFLCFVVETTLAGRADRIKGYTIGVEALGRPESFDPQLDPIVRIEAMRLRRALDRYYVGEGAEDPVIVELPRGRYVPVFHVPAPVPRWRRVLRAVRRVLRTRIVLHAPGQRLLAGEGARLLPPPRTRQQHSDGRQIQQAQGAPAARPRRPRSRRDRGDPADGRDDPRRL